MQEDHSSFSACASWPANVYVRPAEIPVTLECRSQCLFEFIRELLVVHCLIIFEIRLEGTILIPEPYIDAREQRRFEPSVSTCSHELARDMNCCVVGLLSLASVDQDCRVGSHVGGTLLTRVFGPRNCEH